MQKQKSTPPWRSKLTPYQDEILTAWYQERATLKTIQSRLAEYGITITLSGISRFIRCRKNSTDPHQPPQPIKSAAPPKDPLAELTEKSVAQLEAEWQEEQNKKSDFLFCLNLSKAEIEKKIFCAILPRIKV